MNDKLVFIGFGVRESGAYYEPRIIYARTLEEAKEILKKHYDEKKIKYSVLNIKEPLQ